MNAVYTVYVWRYGKLLHVAENIVASDCDSATKRGVYAIKSRAGMGTDPLLQQLSMHLNVANRPMPEGVQVQVRKRIEGPVTAGVVCT